MSKFFGFILGVAVALAGPAAFGVLAADGGFELNAKEMALAYGIGALIFWAVVSYFAGAAALGAALTFGAMIYAVHWIPNRTTNFLNDVPGVTTGMIDGIKQYTLNGVVPILAVISLVYAIQLIVRTVQRRRRERAELERAEREQELAQAQQESEATAAYPVQNPAQNPVAGGDYPTMVDNRPDSSFGNRYGNTSYDDLFDEDPEPLPPRNVAEEQPTQFAGTPGAWGEAGADADETVLVPTDRDETEVVPTTASTPAADETVASSTNQPATTQAQPTQATAPQAEAVDTEPAKAETAQPEAGPAQAQAVPAQTAPAQAAPAEPVGATPADTARPETAPAGPGQAAEGNGEPGKDEGADRSKAAEPGDVSRPAAGQSPQPPVAQAAAQSPQSPVAQAAAQSPQAAVLEGAAGAQVAPVVEGASQAHGAPVVEAVGAPRVVEEVGQQYRERMDGPEFDTGEFPAFENPVVPEEDRAQAPRIMPGHFRPAGA